MENLNDAIFDSVKNSLENGDDMLIKICMGTATEDEKKKWQKEKGLTDEVISSLKEYCDIGYNTACKLDNQIEQQKMVEDQRYNSLLEKLESLTLEVARLTERVDHLENDRLSKISDVENARILQLHNNL